MPFVIKNIYKIDIPYMQELQHLKIFCVYIMHMFSPIPMCTDIQTKDYTLLVFLSPEFLVLYDQADVDLQMLKLENS